MAAAITCSAAASSGVSWVASMSDWKCWTRSPLAPGRRHAHARRRRALQRRTNRRGGQRRQPGSGAQQSIADPRRRSHAAALEAPNLLGRELQAQAGTAGAAGGPRSRRPCDAATPAASRIAACTCAAARCASQASSSGRPSMPLIAACAAAAAASTCPIESRMRDSSAGHDSPIARPRRVELAAPPERARQPHGRVRAGVGRGRRPERALRLRRAAPDRRERGRRRRVRARRAPDRAPRSAPGRTPSPPRPAGCGRSSARQARRQRRRPPSNAPRAARAGAQCISTRAARACRPALTEACVSPRRPAGAWRCRAPRAGPPRSAAVVARAVLRRRLVDPAGAAAVSRPAAERVDRRARPAV